MKKAEKIDKYEQVKDAIKESDQCLCAIFSPGFELMGFIKLDDIFVEINRIALNFSEAINTQVIGCPFGKKILWIISQQTQLALPALRESKEKFCHTLEHVLVGVIHLESKLVMQ